MFSSVVSEREFNVVIPHISAFSFIQDCVGDAALSPEFMLIGGAALFSSMMVVVGKANSVVLLFNPNKLLDLLSCLHLVLCVCVCCA